MAFDTPRRVGSDRENLKAAGVCSTTIQSASQEAEP